MLTVNLGGVTVKLNEKYPGFFTPCPTFGYYSAQFQKLTGSHFQKFNSCHYSTRLQNLSSDKFAAGFQNFDSELNLRTVDLWSFIQWGRFQKLT